MTSVLRLGSKDRSSFLFFKRQNNASEAPSDSFAHRLPDISSLDTGSFAGMFDNFMSNETHDALQPQQPHQPHQPERTPTLTNGIQHSPSIQTRVPVKASDTRVDLLKVNIARNDSSASSCYSQPSQRESDYSPLVTRQSSSSSYTPEPSPAQPKPVTARQPQPLTLPARSAQLLSGHFSESPVSAQPSPSRANSSLVRVVSVLPPDLHKPLPPGPKKPTKPFSSVPDLLLRQAPAELPSGEPTLATYRSSSVQKPSTQQERKIPTRRGSDGGVAMELPAWSSASMREARQGKTAANSHHRNRSVSDTEVPQYGRYGNDKSRRHTVDPQKLMSSVSSRQIMTGRRKSHRPIAASTAERVIYRIMCSVHTADDLQATAMVSKGFYRTFQRNQSKLVSHLIFKSSRPAWELRRSTLALKGSSDFLLKDYRRDCRTLDALKAFIIAHCSANCKPNTLVGLLGQDEDRKVQIDNALWRISTFCTLFGNTVSQPKPGQAEIDWLNGSRGSSNKQLGAGFAIGNGQGLSARELEDMNEMWQCLEVLLSGFRGREQEAKRYGVFDNWHLRETSTESQHLGEWISYLLALGPETVLTLSGCSFEQARMLGLTNWPMPPTGNSRSSFLTSAISQVYQERVLEDATQRAAQMSLRRSSAYITTTRTPSHRPTKSLDEQQRIPMASIRTEKIQTHSLRIDTSAPRRKPITTNVTTNVKLEIRPDCDPESARIDVRPDCDPSWGSSQSSAALPTSPTVDPTVYYSLSTTATASAKLGATLFPMEYASPAPRVPFPAPERSTVTISEVIDPVDKAMNLLVRELGYPETRARKALAMCDTGSGINLQKAIELLSVDSKDVKYKYAAPVELPTPGGLASPNRLQLPRAYCDGHCKPASSVSHARNQSAGTIGTATDVSLSPVSAIGDTEWSDTISPLAGTPISTSRKSTIIRGPSKAKAWKVLGIDNLPKRNNSVLRIDEYQAKVERRKSMRAAASTGPQGSKVKDGLSKNLLGLGLGIGSSTGAKSVEEQLDRVREDERRKKEKSRTSFMPRYA